MESTTEVEHQLNDTEWSDNLENLVRTWALKAVLQREMHNEMAKHYKIISTRLTMPLIMLTTVTSVGSFGAVDSEQYKIWMYITGGLNLFAAFLASVLKYLKPDERCSSHTRTSKSFDAYYRELVIQLSLSPEDRDNSEEFIKQAKQNMEKLVNDSPMVIESISRRTLNKHNISPPNDFQIVIYGREENTAT